MPRDIQDFRKCQPVHWLRWGLTLWSICLLAILTRMLFTPPGRRSLYPVYALAAKNWHGGEDLYPAELKGFGFPLFRYSPTVAASLVPLTYLPYRAADLLWRLINWGILLGGYCWWSQTIFGKSRLEAIGWMMMLMLPLAIGNLNNGQSNSLVLGLLLASLAAVAGERWNLAAVLLAAACLFKVYPIAIGLLLCLLYPRHLTLRLVGALALGLAFPFILQEPAYVHRQYSLWLSYMHAEDRTTWPIHYNNLDFQLLCRVWLTPISPRTYHRIQLLAAAAIALVCLAARRCAWKTERLLTLVLGLGSVWMTVFGPATESPTYLLVAPTAAGAVLTSWLDRRSFALRTLLVSAYALLVSAQMVTWFAGLYLPYRALGPQPIAGLVLAIGLMALLFDWPGARLGSFLRSVALDGRKSNASLV